MGINIAIDGTAGSGKGTISKRLAKILGFYCLDTGAIYRAIGYKAIKEKISFLDKFNICDLMRFIDFNIIFEKDENGVQIQHNILDGEDLGDKIRTEEVSRASSVISQIKCVRDYSSALQHRLAREYDMIVEGRDIGTIVLPHADYKFFLTASPEVRARRRMRQLGFPESEYKNVLRDINDRDERDSTRELSPLKVAADAHYIDNSDQTIDETLQTLLSYIKLK